MRKRLTQTSLIFLILAYSACQNTIFAQDTEDLEKLKTEIHKKIGKSAKTVADEQKDLAKAAEYKKTAEEQKDQINELYKKSLTVDAKEKKKLDKEVEKIEKKMKKNEEKAADIYKKCHKKIFENYDKNLAKVRITEKNENQIQGKKSEDEARKVYANAQKMRDKADKTKNSAKYKILTDAYDIEIIAIDHIIKSYGYYLFMLPVNNPEEPDKNKNKNKNEDDLFVITDSEAEKVKEKEKEKTENSQNKNKPKNQATNVKSGSSVKLTYKIQILALVKNPIPTEKLSKTCNSYQNIETTQENGWYKYLVGDFNSLAEAEAYKNSICATDAFIIAYKNGVRISVKEAQELEKQPQN